MGCQSIAGLPPALSSPVPIYTWVERGTVRVKCLAQEHNTMSPARARTWTAQSGDERTNHEATAPVSEYYPVVPTVLAQSPQGPIHGLHKLSPIWLWWWRRPCYSTTKTLHCPCTFSSGYSASLLSPTHGSATCAQSCPCSGASSSTCSYCSTTLHSSLFSRLLGSSRHSIWVCCCRSSQVVWPPTRRPVLAKSGLGLKVVC